MIPPFTELETEDLPLTPFSHEALLDPQAESDTLVSVALYACFLVCTCADWKLVVCKLELFEIEVHVFFFV